MRRIALSLVCGVLSVFMSSAQNDRFEDKGDGRFLLRAQTFMGGYLNPCSNIKQLGPKAPSGINLGVELPSSRQRPWQQYLNDPTVGLGISYLNFGHDVLGEGIAMYPYILISALKTDFADVSLKVAAGLTAVSGYYESTLDEEIPNMTFGSCLNSYLNAGLDLDIPIARNIAVNGELGFYHISNGRISEPNKGVNVLYGGVGLIAALNPGEVGARKPLRFPDLPYRWSLNITGAAGVQNADLTDDRRFMISTFHVGAIYSMTNWYGIGLGADIFYNDAIGSETDRGLFCPEHHYTASDKIRAGLSLNNEVKFGDLIALVDWGIYLINPSRHYYSRDHEDFGHDSRLPLFYETKGAGSQESFHYIRFGVKYRVWDNLHLQALAKTHLHICEYIEFGLNYQIPFVRKSQRERYGSVFHHSRNWWKD